MCVGSWPLLRVGPFIIARRYTYWHMVFAPNTMQDLSTADTGLMYANAVAEAHRTLMRGFTTVRDTGGPTFGLQAAIDAGDIPGPRVYPSGALISQTGGHGDFSPAYTPPLAIGGQPGHYEEIGAFAVANGVPEVLAAVRNQLKKGASQIKLALGGGVISDSDPIDTLQFTPEEIRAAVQATNDWGTYVAVHVYTSAGIRRALDAGIHSIEHGHLADEDTIRLIGEKGAWLSTQPFQLGDNPLTPAAEKGGSHSDVEEDRWLGEAARHQGRFRNQSVVPARRDIQREYHADPVCRGLQQRRDAQDRNLRQLRAVRHEQGAESLQGIEARRNRGGRLGGHAAGGQRPHPGYQRAQGLRTQLCRHHEGRHDLQEHADLRLRAELLGEPEPRGGVPVGAGNVSSCVKFKTSGFPGRYDRNVNAPECNNCLVAVELPAIFSHSEGGQVT